MHNYHEINKYFKMEYGMTYQEFLKIKFDLKVKKTKSPKTLRLKKKK